MKSKLKISFEVEFTYDEESVETPKELKAEIKALREYLLEDLKRQEGWCVNACRIDAINKVG